LQALSKDTVTHSTV